MAITLRTELEMEVIHCSECGAPFAFSANMVAQRRRDHATFHCPAGHRQHYPGKSDLEKLRDQLASETAKRDQAEAAVKAERQARATAEKKLDRARQRVGAGSCPCCKRHFKALSRHMACKHPAYKDGGAS